MDSRGYPTPLATTVDALTFENSEAIQPVALQVSLIKGNGQT
jgi:hypothetical protein